MMRNTMSVPQSEKNFPRLSTKQKVRGSKERRVIAKLRWAAVLAIIAISVLIAYTHTGSSSPSTPSFPTVHLGDKQLSIELALTLSEQARGLTGRGGIPDGHGLVFVHRSPRRLSYWMNGVDFPLDIGFFTADGVLRELYPLDAQDRNITVSTRDDLLIAVEVRRGWFEDNNVGVGTKLEMAVLKEAIEGRMGLQ
ncbi:Protein of unknown function DUF192 [Carpediemonas membranifera]|uniref:DUF192 domain-containing protein n=1 Tax=Carpediemonas membranifera TaxID=201153 RepID=A0A8J6B9R8_9EUKA|nr:Protein of unknown function DUF192 [Carpediemonas membranifera]|eukprot:KAG9392907.1 Protein of unknown function DUF192 [Carpediemonas membranifera]